MSTSTRASVLGGVLVVSALFTWHFLRKKSMEKLVEPENQVEEEPSSQNLLNLLYCQSLEQSRLDGYAHRSITCNSCNRSPIRGFRFKCANCADFDLCEACEAQDTHNRTHVFLKIRVPIPPLSNPRHVLLPILYPGSEVANINNSYALNDFTDLIAKTGFEPAELDAFYDQYKSLSTAARPEGGITKHVFEKCLGPIGLESNLVSDRIFAFFDQDQDGIISFDEMAYGMSILCKGSLDDRIKYAFQGYDLDGDGYVCREELHQMLKAYFRISMELVRDVVKVMEEGIMETFDDEAAKPVSSAFSAPIPENSSPRSISSPEDAASRKQDDISGRILLEGLKGQNMSHLGTSLRHMRKNRISMNPNSSPLHIQATPSMSPRLDTMSPFEPRLPYGTPNLRPEDDWKLQSPTLENYPVMEIMSQNAVEEMVTQVFLSVGPTETEGRLNFEEFKLAVEKDNNLLAWFEALGSVF